MSLAFAVSSAAQAQDQAVPGPAKVGRPASASAASQGPLANGEVLEVDKKAKRVLIKHGPIQHIGMDAMTMEFLVPNDKLLSTLKPGDRVRFVVVWKDGDYVITRIEVLKRRRGTMPRTN